MKKILTGTLLLASMAGIAQQKIEFRDYHAGKEKVWEINDFSATITNPDTVWERRSLPIGNGYFGANVFGIPGKERITLNEKTLWTGGPATGVEDYWSMNRTVSPDTLALIRNLLAQGKNREAHRITARHFRGTLPYDKSKFGTYTMLGELTVEDQAVGKVSGYSRSLQLDSALVKVEFDTKKGHYTRTGFASAPDSVIVFRFEGPVKQNLRLGFATPQAVDEVIPTTDGAVYVGHVPGNGMRWALDLSVGLPKGGKVKATKDGLEITGAKIADIRAAAATDYKLTFNPDFSDPNAYRGSDPRPKVESRIANVSSTDWEILRNRHVADYKNLYDRVDISINPEKHSGNTSATPDRLAAYRAGAEDYALEELYYNFGRYLLIASSRPGSLPANLQGIWHNNSDGPWRVDYHNNINVQMNYWPSLITNLAECFLPYADYIQSLVVPGEKTAQAYYGAPGWTAAISGNPFGMTAPLDSPQMEWNYNPMAGPWLATQLAQYYDYTGDKEWLRNTGYPIVAASADFAAHLLYPYNGYYTSSPSTSPEHGAVDMGATYANAVTRQVLSDAIRLAEVLGTDLPKTVAWQNKLDSILPYRIGQYGQLQEWYEDIDDPKDQHRHTNHLFGLHPGNSIHALHDKELADACRTTLRQRGDAATGWSMGWKLNHWARLRDGDHAYTLLRNLLSGGTASNLWDMHPPFQIDGNFGGTAGMTELVLQTNDGVIDILPALPSKWTDGHIHGLKAHGDITVDIDFKEGKVSKVTMLSPISAEVPVRIPGSEVFTLPLKAGEKMTLSFPGK